MRNEEYLWDRSGEPDDEVRRLESILGELRLAETPALPRRRTRWFPQAIAAALLAGVAIWQTLLVSEPSTSAWQIGGESTHSGQLIRTGGRASTILTAEEIGRVELSPGTELRIEQAASGAERLTLQAGRIEAFIWARPGQFVVDTPSSRAVDLGCRYMLTVNPQGDGVLDVSMGWVAFQHKGRESFIPQGARCRTRRLTGPGLPYFQDAGPGLISAVEEYDSGGSPLALSGILHTARARDSLTLWHLLTRTHGAELAAVYDRFAVLAALPADVSREAVLRQDPAAIDQCWNALGLESADWWRGWKRNW